MSAELLSKVRVFQTEVSMLRTRLKQAMAESPFYYLSAAIGELDRVQVLLGMEEVSLETGILKKYCDTLDEFGQPI